MNSQDNLVQEETSATYDIMSHTIETTKKIEEQTKKIELEIIKF